MDINIVVAKGLNNEIGLDNKLLWRQKSDMEHFKKLTKNSVVIMGKNTYLSIGKKLKDRENIVITREKFKGVMCYDNIELALKHIKQMFGDKRVFVIGGEQIYNYFIDKVNKIYVTEIMKEFPKADSFFPKIPKKIYKKFEGGEVYKSNENNEYDYRFITYIRK